MRKRLVEHLPSYMVPSHIVVLDSFPIASSGKIDHTALPTPDQEESRLVASHPPSDDREHQLLAIWQEVLKIPNIGVDDDFFELGGTSLQALMVFAKIETRLNCSLSPTTLVQAPTLARLAEFIRTTILIEASQSLVPLRVSGKGLPLFLVHNLDCYVLYYRHLLSALTSDQPVFGLQPSPSDGKHHIPRTVETMAVNYISEIRRVQPHGPYLIAGHSFGGLVSFEIAQQLVRQGEPVCFLGLIDTVMLGAPDKEGARTSVAESLGLRVFGFFHKLRRIRKALLVRQQDLLLRLGRPIPYEQRPDYYFWLCRRASRNYVPKPYIGHIALFSSAGNSERQRVHWGPLARGGLTVLEVPASHNDMLLPPHCNLLAEHFGACLHANVWRQ
jgi:thioesterase domain-containing protein/acyl carrier protein